MGFRRRQIRRILCIFRKKHSFGTRIASGSDGNLGRGSVAVKPTIDWYKKTGQLYAPCGGREGVAHLSHYSAQFQEWGDGPPLVLVPGLAGGIRLLGPLVKRLEKNYRVIAYQTRGEENCFTLRRPFSLPDLASDLREFLDHLKLETPALFGVSFGGAIALEFACRFSPRISKLIVQGTGASLDLGILSQVASTVLNRFPLPTDNPFVNQFFNLLFGGKRKKDGLFDFVTRTCWETDQSVMAHRFQLVESFDVRNRLDRIRVPTLLMAGERDVLVSGKSLAPLCDEIADVEFVRMARCGHLAFVTMPDVMGDHVDRFLQKTT